MDNKEILILGGTGSLGKTLVKILKRDYKPRGIRIFSRDETKQWEFKKELIADDYGVENVSFLLGDIRDKDRLKRVMAGVDIVINCAAQKHVPSCEENPLEAVKTNVLGTANIIEAALDRNVAQVMHVSTDKAVYPVNLYGATKTVAEKLISNANVYRGGTHRTVFSCVRYGNVLGSRGSIVPLFRSLASSGKDIPITDNRMTRFFIKLPQVGQFILDRLQEMEGGEIFIPKMKGIRICDLAKIIAPDSEKKVIGIRQGEKLHECLISEEEARWHITSDLGDYVTLSNTKGVEDPTGEAYTSQEAAITNEITEEDLDGMYL